MKVGHTSRVCPLLNQPIPQPPRYQQPRYSPPFENQYSRFTDNRYRYNNDKSYNNRPSYQQYSRGNYSRNNNNNYNGYNNPRNGYSRGNIDNYNRGSDDVYRIESNPRNNDGNQNINKQQFELKLTPYLARKGNNNTNDQVGIIDKTDVKADIKFPCHLEAKHDYIFEPSATLCNQLNLTSCSTVITGRQNSIIWHAVNPTYTSLKVKGSR